jgi:two-component system NtrC family sensor kinase
MYHLIPSDLIELVAETSWPASLLSSSGRVLALNTALCQLLGIDQSVIGTSIDTLVPAHDRARVRSMFEQATSSAPPTPIRTHLRWPGQSPLRVELEVIAIPGDPARRTMLMVHPLSLTDRREQLLLRLNQIAPTLLIAQSPEEVFHRAAETLKSLGLGMGVTLCDPHRATLRLAFATVNSVVDHYLSTAGLRYHDMPIPSTTPGFSDALTDRTAIFWTDPRPILHEIMPAPVAVLAQMLLRLQGIREFIFAPLLAGEQMYGVLAVWSSVLSVEDVPFIEALGNQIAGVLAQIDLRNQMATQIQRLDSLASTAQAVTRLGSLEDVLRVVCQQAQDLLGGEHAAITLPVEGQADTICVMATGRGAEATIGMRMPNESSLVGRVFTSGRGLWTGDSLQDPHAYQPAAQVTNSRSALFQPLCHHGRILGVLVVNHSRPSRFSQDDLEYLARYAEYAAVAVANARLYREAEGVRSYLNTLMRHTPDVLLTIRQDMTIHALNPERLAAVAGYRPEQVEGRPFMDFIPKSRHAELLPRWHSVLSGRPQTLEAEIIGADGRLLVAIMSAALIPEYGEVFVIIKDVTAQKQLEMQLHQSEKLAALGRLVAGAAHELNNPLAAILGLAQLHLLEELPPALRTDIEQMEHAALRASHIVKHLRTFARPQPATPQSIDLRRLVDETLRRLGAEIAARSIVVGVDIAADLPQLVADVHQVEQVLFNVVHNAVLALASNPPGAPRVLTIRAAASSAICLAIGDSGPGIAPEHLARIFDPFFTTRRVGEGSGLGLSIVHAIVQQHGGRIWAESDLGQGTTFYVELPLVEAPSPPAAEPRPAAAGSRILLVEDEDGVRTVAARGLARLGYEVEAVADGAAALERALAQDYDLVISDLQMPGMDGATLYRRLRELRPGLRWLILTGDTMGERSRTFLEDTSLPVLPKPFTRDQLAARVAASLAGEGERVTG